MVKCLTLKMTNRVCVLCLRQCIILLVMECLTMDSGINQERHKLKQWFLYLFCLSISVLFMFFYGLNSPIHTFNSHCDYQWYLTMGRSWVAGKIPYRDLFEQKGPIIYAVFAIASLFPNVQFIIWCFEVVIVSLFLYFCYRIACKFLSQWLSLLVLPLMMLILSTNYCRGLEGACVEEYCLPIFAYGLLCFLDFIMDHKTDTWQRCLVLGVCMGILLWTKFTMLEFFLVPLLIWLIINLKKHQFKSIARSILIMFCGVLIITIPIVICFTAVGALYSLLRIYFWNNFIRYNGDYLNSSGVLTSNPYLNFIGSFRIGIFYVIALVWGVINFAIRNWKQKGGWQLLIAVLLTWLMVGFFCGYFYYYLPLFTYTIFGAIYFVDIIAHVLTFHHLIGDRPLIKLLIISLFIVLEFFTALPFVANTSEIGRTREKYAQLMVADIITEYNQTSGHAATLFCYRMVDCGFYNAANLIPSEYYYAQNCFTEDSFPEMFESFDNTIREQKCDFVITYSRTYYANRIFLETYYHPYCENDLKKSTLPFLFFEPSHYGNNEIVVLLRN